MKDYKLSLEQIDDMKHCIGFGLRNPLKRRRNKKPLLYAYRNYFTTGASGELCLDELVLLGLMEKAEWGTFSKGLIYHVTEIGIKYLEELFDIEIETNEEQS